MTEFVKRSTVIRGAVARSGARALPLHHPEAEETRPFPDFNRRNMFLFDSDRPKEDPNDLLNRMGGRMTDPTAMNHGCPFCNRVMAWALFCSHMEYCFTKWRKTMSVTRRKFTGATPEGNS